MKQSIEFKNNLLLNLPLTFWIMVMQCLMLLELCNVKNVSKMFSDLVNCNIRHKKVSNLMNSICNQNL